MKQERFSKYLANKNFEFLCSLKEMPNGMLNVKAKEEHDLVKTLIFDSSVSQRVIDRQKQRAIWVEKELEKRKI
ncbi:MAG: hypothetical protein LAN71_17685 [Acidobacteriia bacterium]|nr:hypothetical protein [Terriglobia bacterium]